MTITAGPLPRTQQPEAVPPGSAPQDAAPSRAGRRLRGRILTGALSLLVVGAVFGFALPRLASYGSVWASLSAMRWPGLALIAAAFAGSQLATWAMITAVLPSIRLREAATVNLGSSAVANTLPAGGAVAMGVSWAMMSGWGVRTAEYVRYTVISGLWNVFARLGLPVAALSILVITGRSGLASDAAAATGAGVLIVFAAGFAAMLRSDRVAHLVGRMLTRVAGAVFRLVRRTPPAGLGDVVPDFRAGASRVVAERGLRITLMSVASQLTLWLVLLACLRGSGVGQGQVPWETSLAAFAFVQLLAVLPITPGGVGVVEVGLTGSLVMGMDATGAARVAAAVLLYRAVTYLLPLPLGGAAYLWWRRSRRPGAGMGTVGRRARRAAGPAAPHLGVRPRSDYGEHDERHAGDGCSRADRHDDHQDRVRRLGHRGRRMGVRLGRPG